MGGGLLQVLQRPCGPSPIPAPSPNSSCQAQGIRATCWLPGPDTQWDAATAPTLPWGLYPWPWGAQPQRQPRPRKPDHSNSFARPTAGYKRAASLGLRRRLPGGQDGRGSAPAAGAPDKGTETDTHPPPTLERAEHCDRQGSGLTVPCALFQAHLVALGRTPWLPVPKRWGPDRRLSLAYPRAASEDSNIGLCPRLMGAGQVSEPPTYPQQHHSVDGYRAVLDPT